jgi:formiminotetrahydrofolate cyclodeaminase
MAIARACAKIIDLCPAATDKGNVAAVSDAGVGAVLAAAALESAALNVDINLASIKDEAFVSAKNKELAQLIASKLALKDEVLRNVKGKLGG